MMKTKLSWWVPFGSQVSKAKRELPKVFPIRVIVRLFLSVLVLIIVGATVLPRSIPELEFDWTHALLICLVSLAAILAMCCVISLIPPYVVVTPKSITVTQGQSTAQFPFADLAELRIDEQTVPPTLVLRRKNQAAPRTFAISPKVDLRLLHEAIDPHRPKR